MNSLKEKITKQHPQRVPFKFLTRNLIISNDNNKAFRKICMKRLYLKKVIDTRVYNQDVKESDYRPFKYNKLFKTLISAQIPSFSKIHVHECLRISKHLKHFSLNSEKNYTNLKLLAFYIRKLPVNIQTVSLQIYKSQYANNKYIYKIAKSIRFLHKLKSFQRYFRFDRNQNHVQKELLTYSHSVSRLPAINRMAYIASDNEQPALKRVMRRDFIISGITSLEMRLVPESFSNPYDTGVLYDRYTTLYFDKLTDEEKSGYQEMLDDLKREDESKKDDLEGITRFARTTDKTNQQQEEAVDRFPGASYYVLEKLRWREEIKSFCRFELFPDLKEFVMITPDLLEFDPPVLPLGPYLVDGFAALKKLEKIQLYMGSSLYDVPYIFKAMLELPKQIKYFDFDIEIDSLENKDWPFLHQFLIAQKSLESFRFVVRGKYYESFENNFQKHFETAIKCLNDKPFLKSLELISDCWTLEALSQAFAHLQIKNQLQTLKFIGRDCRTSSQTLSKRVEGLCNFIQNQKESLKSLHISLPMALESEVVTRVVEASSKSTQLKELNISAHFYDKTFTEASHKSSKWHHKKRGKTQTQMPESKCWSPDIAKYLRRLENLENLSLEFSLGKEEEEEDSWFIDILRTLPNLVRLQNLHIKNKGPCNVFHIENLIIAVMNQLQNIQNIDFDDSKIFNKLKKEAYEIREKQGMKCSLMF